MTVRFKLLLALIATGVTPYLIAAQDHAAEGGGGGGLFSVNPGLTIWTIIVFVFLLVILGRYAWGPILSAVDAREARIQASLDAAQQKSDEIETLVAEQRQHLNAARQEAQQIVAESRESGERVRKDIEEKARTEGQALLERARAEIDREKDAALESIRRESVEIALAAASRLVGDRLDADRDRELATSYIQSLSGKGDGAQA